MVNSHSWHEPAFVARVFALANIKHTATINTNTYARLFI